MARMNFNANMRAVSILQPQTLDIGTDLIRDIDFQHCLRGVLLVHMGEFAGSTGTFEFTLYTSDEEGISDTSDLIPVWTDSDGDPASETLTEAGGDENQLHTFEIGDAVRRYLYLEWEVENQDLSDVSVSAVGWHAPHRPVRTP